MVTIILPLEGNRPFKRRLWRKAWTVALSTNHARSKHCADGYAPAGFCKFWPLDTCQRQFALPITLAMPKQNFGRTRSRCRRKTVLTPINWEFPSVIPVELTWKMITTKRMNEKMNLSHKCQAFLVSHKTTLTFQKMRDMKGHMEWEANVRKSEWVDGWTECRISQFTDGWMEGWMDNESYSALHPPLNSYFQTKEWTKHFIHPDAMASTTTVVFVETKSDGFQAQRGRRKARETFFWGTNAN